MKVSNVVAAVAGGLVLGAAVFMPLGANALNQEIQQASQAQAKIVAPASDEQVTGVLPGDVEVDPAAVDPITEETSSPHVSTPTTTPTPEVSTPTFSGGDDDEDSNDDDSYGEDSEDDESDD